ncbi:hypothetical protein B0H14DRAFT_202570 [Mycena olivaceomarginata]|nr:hypothetical protein B0H14DRAFT_202570 [Mycena olivaceomarginata]
MAAASQNRMLGLEADRVDENTAAQNLDHEHFVSSLRSDKAYPVLTLPTEIVAEIFIHFLPVYPHFPPYTGILSPTSLTHICRRWREIAISIPALWSAIELAYNINVSFQRQADIIDLWLERSCSFPLSIRLDMDDNEGVYVSKALSSIIAHHSRWEYLKLVPRGISRDTLGFPATEGSMPLLHHLHLELDAATINPVAFRELPLLRSAVLNDIAASLIVLPWRQLTSLALRRNFLPECAPVLKQTPNLVHCTLHLFFTYLPYDHSDIILPCLESLVLNNPAPYAPVSQYLTPFVTPALCRLRVPERFIGSDPICSPTSLMSRSGCKLSDLDMCITGERSLGRSLYQNAFPLVRRLSFSRSAMIGSDSDSSLSGTSTDSEEESVNNDNSVCFIVLTPGTTHRPIHPANETQSQLCGPNQHINTLQPSVALRHSSYFCFELSRLRSHAEVCC